MALAALRQLSDDEFAALARGLKKMKPGKPTQSRKDMRLYPE